MYLGKMQSNQSIIAIAIILWPLRTKLPATKHTTINEEHEMGQVYVVKNQNMYLLLLI
jgi:hypothetical protein